MINLTTEFYENRLHTETLEGGGVESRQVREIEDLKSGQVMRILLSMETHLVFREKVKPAILWQCWIDVRKAEFGVLREWPTNG